MAHVKITVSECHVNNHVHKSSFMMKSLVINFPLEWNLPEFGNYVISIFICPSFRMVTILVLFIE